MKTETANLIHAESKNELSNYGKFDVKCRWLLDVPGCCFFGLHWVLLLQLDKPYTWQSESMHAELKCQETRHSQVSPADYATSGNLSTGKQFICTSNLCTRWIRSLGSEKGRDEKYPWAWKKAFQKHLYGMPHQHSLWNGDTDSIELSP